MFRRRYFGRFLALGLVASVAACGGGGGGSSAPPSVLPNAPGPSSTVAPASAGTAPASFTITVPRNVTTGAHSRLPRTVPNGTQSIQFTLIKSDNTAAVPGTQSQVYPLTATSPGCSQNPTSAAITCTLQLAAPIGNDIYTADVYGTTTGTGTKLGSGTVKLSVQQNATNNASLTLNGTVAAIGLGSDDTSYYGYLTAASGISDGYETIPNSRRIFVVALDAQGNQIIAPDTYGVPVTLVLNGYAATLAHARLARGARRSPLASPTTEPSAVPSPTADVIAAATLTANYAYPPDGVSTGSSSGTGVLTIESPADKITLTANAVTTPEEVVVIPAINGVAATSPDGTGTMIQTFEVIPGTCPAGDTGAPYDCTPIPPSPTPCPSGDTGPAGDCSVISFTSVGESEMNSANTYSSSGLFQATSGSTATFTFPSLTYPSVPNFIFNTNDPAPTWTVLVSPDSGTAGASCSQLLFSTNGLNYTTLPATVAAVGTSFSFTAQVPGEIDPVPSASASPVPVATPVGTPSSAPTPPAHGFSCGITVQGSGAGSNANGHLTIYVNNVTGTIQ